MDSWIQLPPLAFQARSCEKSAKFHSLAAFSYDDFVFLDECTVSSSAVDMTDGRCKWQHKKHRDRTASADANHGCMAAAAPLRLHFLAMPRENSPRKTLIRSSFKPIEVHAFHRKRNNKPHKLCFLCFGQAHARKINGFRV